MDTTPQKRDWEHDSFTAAEIIRFWNDTPLEEIHRQWLPYLSSHRHLLPENHPVQQLIDRWDPDRQEVLPCEHCRGLLWEHQDWCPDAVDWASFHDD